MMKILTMLPKLGLLFALAFTGQVRADDTPDLDNTVASGIVFKLVCLFGCEGTWSDIEQANPQRFQNAMNLISKDIALFSDTERGASLKKESEQLIAFLSKGVRLTSEPATDGKADPEAETFFKDLGLDPKKSDPADLAKIFDDRIKAYAKLSKTPTWVYDREHVIEPRIGLPFGEVCVVKVEFVEKRNTYIHQNVIKEPWLAKVISVNGVLLEKPVTMEYSLGDDKVTKGKTYEFRAYESFYRLGNPDGWDKEVGQFPYHIHRILHLKPIEPKE